MELHENMEPLAKEEKAILKTLLYYDLFLHPLTFEELSASCDCNHENETLKQILKDLVAKALVYEEDNFYYLYNNRAIVDERKKELRIIQVFLERARVMSKVIASFPFVIAILLSGSISKYRMYVDGDLDFFIITKPGRLWIARTLLVIFKKIFLLNSYKYLCLNYFVDSNSLKVEDQNLFNATEIITLIPTYNYSLYQKLLKENHWVNRYYPNFKSRDDCMVVNERVLFMRNFIEFLLNNKMGDRLDDLFMSITDKYRRKKFANLRHNEFEKSFITKKNISTHHPDNHNIATMDKFRKSINDFEENYGVSLQS